MTIAGAWYDDDIDEDSGSAYIFDLSTCPTCTGDLDENGVVNTTDLLTLLGAWAPCL